MALRALEQAAFYGPHVLPPNCLHCPEVPRHIGTDFHPACSAEAQKTVSSLGQRFIRDKEHNAQSKRRKYRSPH